MTTHTTHTAHDDRPANALVEAFMTRFVNRRQPYAVQQEDGTYRWRYDTLTPADILAHLRGERTLALSSSDGAGLCRWLCLDVDEVDGLRQLLALNKALQPLGLPGLVEASRRGGHLWLFLETPRSVAAARTRVIATLDQMQAQGVNVPTCELYPDVGTAAHAGLGHAVRIPLGIHRLSGRRYALFDEYGLPCAFTSTEAAMRFVLAWPTMADRQVGYVGSAFEGMATQSDQDTTTDDVGQTVQADQPAAPAPGRVGTRSPVIRWVDLYVSPLDLLAQLAPETEVKKVGRGYLGWCPFHDDRERDVEGRPGTPSFYVVQDRRYGWSWRCLSTNCEQHDGPMRHSFRLFQELTGLSVASAVLEALSWWPEADMPRRAGASPQEERSDSDGIEDPAGR